MTTTVQIIDEIVEQLNTIEGIVFTRDAWENKTQENYGWVELNGQTSSVWADDKMLEQAFGITITMYVNDDDDAWARRVQDVLTALELNYSLQSRGYDYDMDAVRWRWSAWLFGPLTVEAVG